MTFAILKATLDNIHMRYVWMHSVWKSQKKVSYNIASEASYVYIGQKFIKNAKNGWFGEFFKTEVCSHTVLPDMQISVEPKLLENAKNYSSKLLVSQLKGKENLDQLSFNEEDVIEVWTTQRTE